MDDRFFVTVIASSKRALIQLQKYGFDLFQPTARAKSEAVYTIEGLLTMHEIIRLVKDGYRVQVEEPAEKRAHAQSDVISFGEWLNVVEE